MLELNNSDVPVYVQSNLLSVNRSTIYYKNKPKFCSLKVKDKIEEIYTRLPFYGYRRINKALNDLDFKVNHKTVLKYMKEMGLKAIYPGPNLSKRNKLEHTYPYLVKDMEICRNNQVWGIDITYIKSNNSWFYLVAVIDWNSRYILSWELSQSLKVEFVIEALKRAFEISKPEIINSDQGSHFTSKEYIDILKDNNIKISMDGKGRATDNAKTERFWRTIKYEYIYLNEYKTPRELRLGIVNYIDYYNNKRIHQSLKYKTPSEVYNNFIFKNVNQC